MFFKKKVNSDEYQILINKIVLLTGDLDVVKTDIANMKQRLNSMQGLENRKGKKKVDPIVEEEDIKTNPLLTEDGMVVKSS